jgi:hypothetical protein
VFRPLFLTILSAGLAVGAPEVCLVARRSVPNLALALDDPSAGAIIGG